jgi:hypothetical protein
MNKNIIKTLNKLFKIYIDLCLEGKVGEAQNIRWEIEKWMDKLAKPNS